MAMKAKGGSKVKVDSVRPVVVKETKNGPVRLQRPNGNMPAGANRKRVNKRSR